MTNLDGWVASQRSLYFNYMELHGRVSIVKLGTGEEHYMSVELIIDLQDPMQKENICSLILKQKKYL